ncbi:roadblock/LC7 domain-containing protein [Streptomyces sp. NPDC049954]|uniref:roadblock/LC7 domain-containing protein n=1 Tax=unclassified Streptomyces TaxID=2593676 RepID=UPI00341507F6
MSTPGTPPVKGAPLARNLSWVLEPLLELPHVEGGVVFSRDGLILGSAPSVSTDDGEAVAAVTSSTLGSVRALVDRAGGGADQGIDEVVVSTPKGLYYVAPAGEGAGLVLWAGREADMGRLAYEVQVQVSKLVAALTEAAKSRAPSPS